MEERLTDEQRAIVEENMWIVNAALKSQGLAYDNDLRQSALLYLCSVVKRYDASRGVKFSTYAYKNVYLFIKRIAHKETVRREHIIDYDIADLAEDNIICDADTQETFDSLICQCDDREQHIVNLMVRGYNGRQIADHIGCSASTVSTTIQIIRRKARTIQK